MISRDERIGCLLYIVGFAIAYAIGSLLIG